MKKVLCPSSQVQHIHLLVLQISTLMRISTFFDETEFIEKGNKRIIK
ncbi:MAG TPA: hypothetical protein VHJ38_06080 [Nitrososphaeraceae archaeon]|nr:hypothetical protein [Nitrososphaeraceae archaeon]